MNFITGHYINDAKAFITFKLMENIQKHLMDIKNKNQDGCNKNIQNEINVKEHEDSYNYDIFICLALCKKHG